MSTLSQIKKTLQSVLGPQADQLAIETEFVRRKRKISGSAFVQGLIFGFLHRADATTEDLCSVLQRQDLSITESGLCQRFNEQSVAFMQRVLQELVSQHITTQIPVPVPLLQRFAAVELEDSSTITLPDALKDIWQGHGGGSGQSKAGIKLHVRMDLRSGRLEGPLITSSRVSDAKSPLRLRGIAKDVLNISDEGYCSFEWLGQQEGYFLTRPRSTTCFFDPLSGKELDLSVIGPKAVNESWDGRVFVGKQARLWARLIMVRVPDEVVKQRRERIQEEARRRGRKNASAQSLMRAQWTILITNVPHDLLCVSEIIVLQRARWQIELLFRLWKEQGQVDEWRAKKPEHIQCEIFAKVMALLIQHWLVVQGTWSNPARSMTKAAKQVREVALDILATFSGEQSWKRVMTRLMQSMAKCRVHSRSKHPSHAQLMQEGIDWCLT